LAPCENVPLKVPEASVFGNKYTQKARQPKTRLTISHAHRCRRVTLKKAPLFAKLIGLSVFFGLTSL